MPTFQQAQDAVLAFNEERNWTNLSPQDLAKAVVIEATELLEHFQWDNTNTPDRRKHRPKDQQEISREAADVLIYLIAFCKEQNVDLLQAVIDKLKHNAKKYPAENFQ